MLKLLSKIYEFSINRINQRFDNKINSIFKANIPVISIGNLSLGGTGKTPFVIMLGKFLLENKIKFGVIGKGYKRKISGEILVGDGQEIKAKAEQAGDEMLLITKHLNVPVLVHNEKYLAAQSLQNLFLLDCIVVDDGFQHRKLHRDVDIVILDEKTISKPHLIPYGRLREPLNSLKRADVICLMDFDKEKVPQIIKKFEEKLIIECKKKLIKVYNLLDNSVWDYDVDCNFIAVSGIGNPDNFHKLLTQKKLSIIDKINFIDHHNYTLNSIKSIISRCNKVGVNSIITTEKDAIKIEKFGDIFALNKIECYVAMIEIEIIINKDNFYEYILKKINKNQIKS